MSGNIWFTADDHFGHAAMARDGKGWRPFDTIEEHDEYLIEQWNARVRPTDQVWHLGDVAISASHGLGCIEKCNGEKHLITGNHDQVWPGHRDAHKHQRSWLSAFSSVQAYARRKVGGQYALLCHFPYRGQGDHTDLERYGEYRLHDEGKWLIHGHVHEAWAQKGRQINVGVDVRDWAPVSLDGIVEIMREESR